MGAEYVCIRSGDFRADIRLDSILEVKVASFRKLMRLMRGAEEENQTAIEHLGEYFSEATAEVKAQWAAASQEFSSGWMNPKHRCLSRSQHLKNAELKANVKNAKARYDRVIKFQSIFKGEQNI